jgi:hypothetical protein
VDGGRNQGRPLSGFPVSGGYHRPVAKRSKKPADLNRLAAAIVGDATDETPQEPKSPQVRAGRIGGQRGGKARAQRMTAEERSEAARRAAESRWSQR